MKKINLLLLLLLVATTTVFGQTAYNPFTQNIHFEPEPSVSGFECGSTPDVVFIAGLTTAADATDWQNNPLQIMVCIGGFQFNGNASAAVSGSYASNFNWAFSTTNPNCIIGTQNQTLIGTGSNPLSPNPLSTGVIRLHLRVPLTSPISTVLSVNADLVVPQYMQTYNSPNDDAESTTTQTFCALTISGNVFNDTTIANSTVDGPPLNNPSDTLLYATLVGPTGLVVASVPVGSNGAFQFTNVTPNTAYSVQISTIQEVVGSVAQIPSLPNGWTNVNEDCCDLIGTDGLDDGKVIVEVTNSSVENVNFGIYSAPTGVLPTILKNFFVTEYNCAGVLTWTTAQEVNASHIEILRKDNPNATFKAIATIQAKGNSNQPHNYSFTDRNVAQQDDYYQYKLKMVDIDGKYTYSEIKTLKLNCETTNVNAFNFFPNPTVDELNIVYFTEESDLIMEVEVVDIAGRKLISQVQELVSGSNFMTLDVSNFATGNYFVKYFISGNSENGSFKFLKN